jgi:hypothetical protein
MTVALLNQWLTPENVMWAAAGLSFALLVLSGPLARVASSPRHDGMVRVVKVCLFTLIPVMVLVPTLLLFAGEAVPGVPCAFYLLFFSLFCYYLGRETGRSRGRKEMSDRVGLEMFDNAEEAADRLYESRQRLATRAEVEQSITAMAKANKQPSAATTPEILDVMVEIEEVEE